MYISPKYLFQIKKRENCLNSQKSLKLGITEYSRLGQSCPLPISQNKLYACTIINTWSEIGLLCPRRKDDPKCTIRAFQKSGLLAMVSQPSQNLIRIHITEKLIQKWVKKQAIPWSFHLPHNPTTSGSNKIL